jgi:hypothetical protein
LLVVLGNSGLACYVFFFFFFFFFSFFFPKFPFFPSGSSMDRFGFMVPAAGKTSRTSSLVVGEEEQLGSANKRHRTRGAMSKRALTAETVLMCLDAPVSSDDEEDEEKEVHVDEPVYRPSGCSIEIPVVRTLTDEEMKGGGNGWTEDGPVEPTSDEWYRKLHVVFEIKEQAFREQATRSSGSSLRRLVNSSGPVSSTELMLAPAVEAKLTKEDHRMVLGKVDLPEVPEERLRAIEGKLEEVEKSYENSTQHYARYYLHTQWAPQMVKVEPIADLLVAEGQPPPKPKLLLKLKRLQDKR